MSGKVSRVITSHSFHQGFAIGVVVGKHSNKTVGVAIDRRMFDRKCESHLARRTLYHVHDELNEAALGDVVVIRQCTPLLFTYPFSSSSFLSPSPLPSRPVSAHLDDQILLLIVSHYDCCESIRRAE